jgi:hypothetical protein
VRNQDAVIAFSTIVPNCLTNQKTNLAAIMLTPEFLRRQAENCLRIARTCFDLASAERLRLMAADLTAKAIEIEEQQDRRQDNEQDHRRQDRWSRGLERNRTSSS